MICRAIPYEGDEPHIFLSYCHKDSDIVYPLLEQMVLDGYRVWYDDGNHAGDDWSENIATHLERCAVCLAVISETAASSHNCRNEINYALEYKKKLLAVLWDDFNMPKGMKLQLGTIHYLKRYEYPSNRSLLLKLYETEAMSECRTTPGSLPMRDSTSSSLQADSDSKKENNIITDSDATISEGEDGDAPTVRAEKPETAVLLRPSTGAIYVLESALSRIGRSKKRCDVVLDDNAYIGNCHAEIIQYKGLYYLRDLGSTNGTYINGKKLEESEKVTLNNLCCFKLYDEPFLFICDTTASQIMSGEIIYFLYHKAAQEVKLLQVGDLLLDRGHKWENGTLNDPKISRKSKHAIVKYDGAKLLLEDLGSRNGTYLNGLDIRGKGIQEIHVNDQIRLGDTTLTVGIITLHGDKE